jgi:hypothetical protein
MNRRANCAEVAIVGRNGFVFFAKVTDTDVTPCPGDRGRESAPLGMLGTLIRWPSECISSQLPPWLAV